MADTIRIKRRSSGAAGAPATLANAELAFNEVDHTLYYGEGGTPTAATTVVPIGGAAKASINSPAFTGTPTAPTASAGTNSGQVATTAFVTAAVSGATAGVASFNGRTGTVTLIASDVTGVGGALLASPVFTGDPKAPTPSVGDNDTSIATTAFVTTADNAVLSTIRGSASSAADTLGELETLVNGKADASALASYALLASPVFTGDPRAPTPATADNDTSVATTAFVKAQGYVAGGPYQPLDGDLTAIAALAGTDTIYYRSGTDTWTPVVMGGNMTFSGGVLNSTGGGGGTPGGSNTQVQFNSSGAFGGSANLTWNNATSAMTITGQLGIGIAPISTYPLLVHAETNGNLAITGHSTQIGVQLRSVNDANTLNQFFEFIGTGYTFGPGGGVAIQNANITSSATSGALTVTGGIGVGGFVNMLRADIRGNSSGVVSIATQSAAGTYNFNLPTTAGTSGQVLTSAGGASAPMTWSTVAPLASPVFTGDPQAPTPTVGDNDTSIATTAFVTAAVAAAGGGATSGARVLIQTQVVSVSSTNVDFKTGIDSTYDEYELHFFGVLHSVDGALCVRISQDGGTTFKAGATDYIWGGSFISFSGPSSAFTGCGASAISFAQLTANHFAGTQGAYGIATFFTPSISGMRKPWLVKSYSNNSTSGASALDGFLQYHGDANPFNGFRLFNINGNITAGTFKLYGIVK